MSRRLRGIVATLALTLVVAACGGADGDTDPDQVDAVEPPKAGACRVLEPDDISKPDNATRTVACTKPHNAETFDGRGVVPCPGLIFMASERDMYVYAFKGTDAPSRETKLYQAPFFNVWSRGKVCVGNADVPKEDRSDDPDAWERMFFGSHFTHPNFTQNDRLTVGVNPAHFWKAQLKKPSAKFPEQVLFDLGLTVDDLMQVDLRARLEAVPRATGEF